MPQSYNELNNTNNKLAILLNRLSYPPKNTPEYWLKWSSQPLHSLVFKIIRGMAEHRVRILRINQELDFTREQYQQLDKQQLVTEDRDRIKRFLQREFVNLYQSEKLELKKLQQFISSQIEQVKHEVSLLNSNEELQWKNLLKDQYQEITSELKRLGLNKELQEFKQQFSTQAG